MNLSVGTILNKYILNEFKGKGTTAEVWSAKDTESNNEVALKIFAPEISLDSNSKNLIKHEFLKTKDLNHTNIINPIDHFEIEGRPVLVFRLCQHSLWEELRQRITLRLKNNDTDKKNIFSEHEMAKIFNDIGGALDYLHRSKLIHHDVKPANILLTNTDGNFEFFLSDFGITKEIRETIMRQTKNRASSLTLAYAAPERLRGEIDNSVKSDIFSLGATIYELTNSIKIPPGEILNNNGKLEAIKGKYSKRFKELVDQCLLKDYLQRPSADEIFINSQFFVENGYWPESLNIRDDQLTQLHSSLSKTQVLDNAKKGSESQQTIRVNSEPVISRNGNFKRNFILGALGLLIAVMAMVFYLKGNTEVHDAKIQINCKNGYKIIQLKNNKCGIINSKGKWVANPDYDKCINLNDSIVLKSADKVDIFLTKFN